MVIRSGFPERRTHRLGVLEVFHHYELVGHSAAGELFDRLDEVENGKAVEQASREERRVRGDWQPGASAPVEPREHVVDETEQTRFELTRGSEQWF